MKRRPLFILALVTLVAGLLVAPNWAFAGKRPHIKPNVTQSQSGKSKDWIVVYRPNYVRTFEGTNFGSTPGKVRITSYVRDYNHPARVIIGSGPNKGEILSWSDTSVTIRLPGREFWKPDGNFPMGEEYYYKLQIKNAEGKWSNPVTLVWLRELYNQPGRYGPEIIPFDQNPRGGYDPEGEE
ncbi:MAG: hypothetical protein K6U74_03330 [Firmicutes bacterium]|nr:hypothetical protein [Bacillota bacterium]